MERVDVYRPTIDEVKGAEEWSALEVKLLAASKHGRWAQLHGRSSLPADCSDPDRRVRPALIRYLMLGGCDNDHGARPHPSGVRIKGGWIDGRLDLAHYRTQLPLLLHRCRVPHGGVLRDARISALYLPGCDVAGSLDLQRLRTEGNIHLRNGFRCAETVNLAGARIGGQLGCAGGQFVATSGRALNCQGAVIGTSVFLSDGFLAAAEVNLVGARIGGQLSCIGGQFASTNGQALNCNAAEIGADVFLRDGFRAEAGVNFARAKITGSLRFKPFKGEAPVLNGNLDLEAARIGAGLFFQSVKGARPNVDLTEARTGSLRDDWEAWDGVKQVRLDGFQYERLDGAMSLRHRLDWLGKADESMQRDLETTASFDPQPYVQLASVLRSQGDRRGAVEVLIEREKKQRQADRAARRIEEPTPSTDLAYLALAPLRFLDWIFGWALGYGHRPVGAVAIALVLVFLAGWLNGAAYNAHQFAPNAPVILTSDAWQSALDDPDGTGQPPLALWLEMEVSQDYETFDRWIYGLDLVLPLDALGQEDAWRATTGEWGAHTLGNLAFYSRWVFQLAGILLAAVGAAVLTGLVGRRD